MGRAMRTPEGAPEEAPEEAPEDSSLWLHWGQLLILRSQTC